MVSKGEVEEKREELEKFLEGKVGEPVLLIDSTIETENIVHYGCVADTDHYRKDLLYIGILLEEKVKPESIKIAFSEHELKGLVIPTGGHLFHDPKGYSMDIYDPVKLWEKKEGGIFTSSFRDTNLGPIEGKYYCPNQTLSKMLLVGEDVPEFFNRGGFFRDNKDDYHLDPSYIHALNILGRQDLAPKKFKDAYEKFVQETEEEIEKCLKGHEAAYKHPYLKSRAIVAGLDKTDKMIALGRGHYVKISEVIEHLQDG